MIQIYGNNNCSWCLKAKALAESYNMQYEWLNTDIPSNLKGLKTRYPEAKTIPQIWWHEKHIGGYQEFAAEVQNTLGSNYGQQHF